MVDGWFPGKEQFDALVASITRLDDTSRPWSEIAAGLERMLDHARRQGWEGDSRVRKMAEDATRLSWGVLARYLSVFRRLGTVSDREGVPAEHLISDGFNATEAAIRLYDRDRTAGLTALKDLHHGRQTLAGVRRDLELARGGSADGAIVSKSLLLRKRKGEIKEVEVALKEDGAALFGERCTIVRRPPLGFFKQIGVEARRDEMIIGGANILTPDAALKGDSIEAVLPAALLMATYVPVFYLLFSPGADPVAVVRAKTAVQNFEAENVGVATTAGSKFDILRHPKPRRPSDPGYERLRDRLLADGR
jgi:hypothetical protein